ncbi:unnamed protein product [Nippostrongylus brasiliensis]|uniref:Uncharacterized protein n=1 Tax=Nippostrongylus brasiliensis TaxID=27835 RepID=A0A0N4YFH0_NIPBR|nr:unnamed protein product [Nippostrongylus brasiliensis]
MLRSRRAQISSQWRMGGTVHYRCERTGALHFILISPVVFCRFSVLISFIFSILFPTSFSSKL